MGAVTHRMPSSPHSFSWKLALAAGLLRSKERAPGCNTWGQVEGKHGHRLLMHKLASHAQQSMQLA